MTDVPLVLPVSARAKGVRMVLPPDDVSVRVLTSTKGIPETSQPGFGPHLVSVLASPASQATGIVVTLLAQTFETAARWSLALASASGLTAAAAGSLPGLVAEVAAQLGSLLPHSWAS